MNQILHSHPQLKFGTTCQEPAFYCLTKAANPLHRCLS